MKDDGAAVEVFVNGVPVGFASPVNSSNTLFQFDSFELNELTTQYGIPSGNSYLNLISSAVRIFDLAGENASAPLSEPLELTIQDTYGPEIRRVFIPSAPGYNLFAPKPETDGPTPPVFELQLNVRDFFPRSAAFPHVALDPQSARNPGNYSLVGDHTGRIPISRIVVTNDPVAAGNVATASIKLLFDQPLADDRFTLTVRDGIADPTGNALDGESNADEPHALPFLPSGDGAAGGDFLARFTVDTRAEIGAYFSETVAFDINGNGQLDTHVGDFTHRDLVFHFGQISDARFTGKFGRTEEQRSWQSQFDVLAAYGYHDGAFRWLFDTNGNGGFDPGTDASFVSNLQINGLPVAGNFDGLKANGDEIGLFDGVTWFLDTTGDNLINAAVTSASPGFPIVGDFDGDQVDDLATFQRDRFFFDLASDGFGDLDDMIDSLGFPGVADRPVAADLNADGIDDIGLWVPPESAVNSSAEWRFLISHPEATPGNVDTLDHAFSPVPLGNDLAFAFGNDFALPIIGNLDPPVADPTVDVPTIFLGSGLTEIELQAVSIVENEWYEFTSGRTGNLNVDLAFAGASEGLTLFLYDQDAVLLAESTHSTTGVSLKHFVEHGDELILRVQGSHDDVDLALHITVNHAPELSIGNMEIAYYEGHRHIDLPTHDVDGDSIEYRANIISIEREAFELQQRHQFAIPNGGYFENTRGAGEKYLVGDSEARWYYLMPDGTLYRFRTSLADGLLVGKLTSDYHSDPSLLIDSAAPVLKLGDPTVALNGSRLTIDVGENGVGVFDVRVEASDGVATSTALFEVAVTNEAPEVDIDDVTVSHRQTSVLVDVPTHDADGELVNYNATANQVDATAQLAAELDKQYRFEKPVVDYYHNYRGADEKYLLGNEGNDWFFILPSGELRKWGTSIEESEPIAVLDSSFHAAPQLLHNAIAPISVPLPSENLVWTAGKLQVVLPDDYVGQLLVTINASDALVTNTEQFVINVVNEVPEVRLGDLRISHLTDVTLDLPLHDADGDVIRYRASLSHTDPVAQLAFDLSRRLDLQKPADDYYHNYRGYQEKYLFDEAGSEWYFILPDGSLHRWGDAIAASPVVAKLEVAYYEDPSLLHDAESPQTAPFDHAVVDIVANQLTIDPDDDFSGSFQVSLVASDGLAETTTDLTVHVTNIAPGIEIHDQSMVHIADSLTINLPVTDDEGEVIGYSTRVVKVESNKHMAYELDQQYDFMQPVADYYEDFRGEGEKYLSGENGEQWFFIKPDGSLWKWKGSIQQSEQVAQFDAAYHVRPELLIDVAAPPSADELIDFTMGIGSVTLDPFIGFVGTFIIEVEATDGIEVAIDQFRLEVTNSAPQLVLSDVTISSAQGRVVVDLPTHDADGELLIYTAELVVADPIAQLAYELNQAHRFEAPTNDYHENYRGFQEKYLLGDDGANWYFLLPSGGLYLWNGAIGSSPLVTHLRVDVYEDPYLLIDAGEPLGASPDDATIELVGSDLIIEPASSFRGTIQVQLIASDGAGGTAKGTQRVHIEE